MGLLPEALLFYGKTDGNTAGRGVMLFLHPTVVYSLACFRIGRKVAWEEKI